MDGMDGTISRSRTKWHCGKIQRRKKNKKFEFHVNMSDAYP